MRKSLLLAALLVAPLAQADLKDECQQAADVAASTVAAKHAGAYRYKIEAQARSAGDSTEERQSFTDIAKDTWRKDQGRKQDPEEVREDYYERCLRAGRPDH